MHLDKVITDLLAPSQAKEPWELDRLVSQARPDRLGRWLVEFENRIVVLELTFHSSWTLFSDFHLFLFE